MQQYFRRAGLILGTMAHNCPNGNAADLSKAGCQQYNLNDKAWFAKQPAILNHN